MFEHLKNYQRLFANIARWLKPGGMLFTHISPTTASATTSSPAMLRIG